MRPSQKSPSKSAKKAEGGAPSVPAKKAPQPSMPPRGMRDVLPNDQPYWEMLRIKAREVATAYGFERIDTPIVEETTLFVRGIGKMTDIVEKEMYSFETSGTEKLTLRPEGTAPTMRSYISNGMVNMPQPVKVWYMGPMFRHERPQHGRYRQFHTFGCEVIGDDDAVTDAQLALMCYVILKEIGIECTVRINSIGTPESRANYKNALVSYFRSKRAKLSDDDKRRLLRNPLRLLDSKDPSVVEMKAEAPQIVDWLDEDSKAHFMRVLEYLDETGVPYQLDPYLVRGLDYYTKTVFEVFASGENEELAQAALAGGGRYDGLAEILGGRPTPAAGFGIGMDRVVSRLKELGIKPLRPATDVFVAQLGEQGRKRALAVFEELRIAGIRASEAFSKNPIKAQMEIANRLGAKWAIVIGQKEVLDGTAIIRDMDSGTQEISDVRKVVHEIKRKLSNHATEPVVERIVEPTAEGETT
ncbi:histidine--tRNA ligase [Patescibacteria group bacterium]|nr:histidine--tRNA ligase [Patescibacteria group bacterium]MBU1448595.1 histidine--tRNA ligase [Patescibacteria group bacterium]MBU2612963.1 histidine--tRNA ligase [Patescibacteria group bacterium]